MFLVNGYLDFIKDTHLLKNNFLGKNDCNKINNHKK